MRLFKRGRIWYSQFYDAAGARIQRSTRCHDKKAAETLARNWEREAADPDYARAAKATLSDAIGLLLVDCEELVRAGKRSPETLSFYKTKAGHLIRLLETSSSGQYVPLSLTALRARDADNYVSERRREGVSENTISKELVALRAALKRARRAGLWRGDPAEVCPIGFAPEYKPRTRWLTQHELQLLLAELTADRAARVAFIVATSACWRETERARCEDVDLDAGRVRIRGTKRPGRRRLVPLVSPEQRTLAAYAMRYAEGSQGALFRPWSNARRDLREACQRADIDPCSPNDLRRTFATWLHAAGATPDLLAPLMGHSDTRMVERVYGRLSVSDLARRLGGAIGLTDCSTIAADYVAEAGFAGPDESAESATSLETSGVVVPRGGIEPPTRGFSVHCSTN